jgi:hypothetical protein
MVYFGSLHTSERLNFPLKFILNLFDSRACCPMKVCTHPVGAMKCCFSKESDELIAIKDLAGVKRAQGLFRGLPDVLELN